MTQQRDASWYIEKAKQEQGLNSNNKLAILMRVSSPTVSNWYRGRDLPKPEYMVKIAELAKMDPEIALADLASWHVGPASPAAPFYQRIIEMLETSKSQKVASSIVALGLSVGLLTYDNDIGICASQPLDCDTQQHQVLYYGKEMQFLFCCVYTKKLCHRFWISIKNC